MVDLIQGLHRLRDATARDEVLGALWDLRDLAFDHPESWHALTAETLFQALAETLEEVPADDREWLAVNRLLARAIAHVVAPT